MGKHAGQEFRQFLILSHIQVVYVYMCKCVVCMYTGGASVCCVCVYTGGACVCCVCVCIQVVHVLCMYTGGACVVCVCVYMWCISVN